MFVDLDKSKKISSKLSQFIKNNGNSPRTVVLGRDNPIEEEIIDLFDSYFRYEMKKRLLDITSKHKRYSFILNVCIKFTQEEEISEYLEKLDKYNTILANKVVQLRKDCFNLLSSTNINGLSINLDVVDIYAYDRLQSIELFIG